MGEGRTERAGTEGRPAVRLATAAVVALGAFVFYFPVYRVRGYRLPVGFDSSWYVWRARFVGEHGLGSLGTASRPGHALLSSVLGSVTGRSQLELAVVLPLVLVAVFALAVGAFWRAGVREDRWCWAVPAALAGTVLGVTRLVGENVANLLELSLVVAAAVPLMVWVARRNGWGLAGVVGLLVGAGLAHWVFLVVSVAMLGVAFVLAAPSSLSEWRAGVPVLRTEAGSVGTAVTATAAVMAVVIWGLLRTTFSTFEIKEDPARFLPKLRTDLSRLQWPVLGTVGVVGAGLLRMEHRTHARVDRGPFRRAKGLAFRFLAGWTVVAAAGLVYGVATKKLPPHRFLAVLVAFPVVVALAAVVAWAAGWAYRRLGGPQGRRAGQVATGAVALAGIVLLSIPGAVAWYRHGPGVWMDPASLQEARTASEYVERLPPGRPFIFLVSPFGPAGVISVPLAERTIRVGLPTDREESAYFFAGEPADLLAGRRTAVPNPRIEQAIDPYWEALRPALSQRPPVLILKRFGPRQFREAVAGGAPEIGPGVALLRGTPPAHPLRAEPLPPAVPRLSVGMLWGAALLGLLWAAGVGWAVAMVGGDAAPEVWWTLAPAAGTAALMIGGLIAAKLGVRLAGPGGVVTYLVVTGLGTLAGAATDRRPGGASTAATSEASH